MTVNREDEMFKVIEAICEKVCCSADCHCLRYEDGTEFTCERCFIEESIQSEVDAAVRAEQNAIIEAIRNEACLPMKPTQKQMSYSDAIVYAVNAILDRQHSRLSKLEKERA